MQLLCSTANPNFDQDNEEEDTIWMVGYLEPPEADVVPPLAPPDSHSLGKTNGNKYLFNSREEDEGFRMVAALVAQENKT
ncbi:hypothetical protein VNO78_14135 [Psophocarpus tetragonolobus]|uniref:Uncharacterized protein n=1 Tax=Psophocarpus tetragonolobus TaxID=3891 RepID=A0AAN9SSP6_PSOTE